MFSNLTPEKAIAFIRYSVTLVCCWPLSPKATKFQLLCYKIARTVLFLNAFVVFVPLVYASYVYRTDYINFPKSAFFAVAVMQILIQAYICFTRYDIFQRIVNEMVAFCEKASLHDRYVFQRYLNRYSAFYGLSTIWFFMTATIVVVGTLFTSQPFPTNTKYPFRVDYEPLRTIIFLQQSLVIMQCAGNVSMNVLLALLVFFAAARFEILGAKLKNVKNITELTECVKKYYVVKSYATDVVSVVQFIALSTVLVCGTVLVFCGIVFVTRQPIAVKLQSLSVACTGFIEVFMCALPSDHLMDVSENTMRMLYESMWYEQSVKMQKDVLFVLMPRSPIVIQVKCILPILSLNYFCSFVSSVFSFFTALRVVMMKDEAT